MSKSIFTGSGYFMNDDRASGGKLAEDDVMSCSHCQAILKKAQWKLQGGMCFVCTAPVCLTCYGKTKQFGCDGPFVKQLERAVDDAYRRQQNAKVLGI